MAEHKMYSVPILENSDGMLSIPGDFDITASSLSVSSTDWRELDNLYCYTQLHIYKTCVWALFSTFIWEL